MTTAIHFTPVGRIVRAASWVAIPAVLVAVAAVPVRAEKLTLDAASAGARAVAASKVMVSARARTASASSRVGAADAAMLPTLSASANIAKRSSVPEFALPTIQPDQAELILVPDVTMVYGASLKASEVIYAGGAIDASRAAAREDEASAQAATHTTAADVKLAGVSAYWEAVRALAAVEAAQAAEVRARRLGEDTQALLQAGMAVQADSLASDERIATAHVVVVRTEGQAANAITKLRSLLNLPADLEVELADTLEAALPARPEPLADLQGEALTRRPELRGAASQIAALQARETQASAARRPAVAATAQYDYLRPNARYFPPLDEWHDSWSVGVMASWTLFDGGKSAADTAALRAQRDSAAADEGELRRTIALNVAVAHRDLETALDALVAADAARVAATARETATRERYQAGVAILADVLDAQSNLTTAETTQINARAAAWQAAAVLDRQVGR